MSNTLHQVLSALLSAEKHVIEEVHNVLVEKGVIKSGVLVVDNPNQLELPLSTTEPAK